MRDEWPSHAPPDGKSAADWDRMVAAQQRASRGDPLDGVQWRDDTASQEENVIRSHVQTLRADPHLEELRRLRDSDRPEDRAQFETLVRGGARIALAGYEASIRDVMDLGGTLPEGVKPVGN